MTYKQEMFNKILIKFANFVDPLFTIEDYKDIFTEYKWKCKKMWK